MATIKTVTPERVSTSTLLKEGLVACFYGTTELNTTNSGILYKDKTNKAGGNVLYYADINGTRYYWFINGDCASHTTSVESLDGYHLYVVDTNISVSYSDSTDPEATTRGSGEDEQTITVKTLTARDTFAAYALQALINKHPDPIDSDISTSTYLAKRAYEYANAMVLVSASLRSADPEETGTPSQSTSVDVNTGSLANNTEKLLNNIVAALNGTKSEITSLRTGTLKVDNPANESFEIEGGGGGGTELTFDAIKSGTRNNLDASTLNNTDLVSVLGFSLVDGDLIPSKNNLVKLMTLIEAAQNQPLNASKYYWLRRSLNDVVITSISTFLEAYETDIYNNQKLKWRVELKKIVSDALTGIHTENSGVTVSSTIATLNNKNVNTDTDWNPPANNG